MSFLGKLGKDLGQAAEKARFEADKALKLNRMGSELGELNNQLTHTFTALGQKVLELHNSGQLESPALEGFFGQITQSQATIRAKQADVDALRASQFAAPAAPPPQYAAGAPPPPVAQAQTPQAMVEKNCPACGAAVGSAKFCPGCGQKQE